MRKGKKSLFFALDCIGFRALIFFDLVKYHMEVTITVPSRKNNLRAYFSASIQAIPRNDLRGFLSYDVFKLSF